MLRDKAAMINSLIKKVSQEEPAQPCRMITYYIQYSICVRTP
jgi:hypothetical protein